MQLHNFFSSIPVPMSEELVEVLWERTDLRLERIVSMGHVTPPGEWYDQESDEWVILLTGSARLRIEDRDDLLEMKPGDYVFLPAHLRHRVEWTAPDQPTHWLALHAKPQS